MCNGSDTDHEMVENPKWRWLVTAVAKLEDEFDDVDGAFDDVETALEGRAWTGPAARRWGQEVDGRKKRLNRIITRANHELTQAAADEPQEIKKCELPPSYAGVFPYGGYGGTGHINIGPRIPGGGD